MALDVVEDKLEETIAQVRPSEEFPNPILRLGKSGSNFARLVSLSSAQQIMREHAVAQTHIKSLTVERERSQEALRESLETTASDFSDGMLNRMLRLHDLEKYFDVSVGEAIRVAVEASMETVFARLQQAKHEAMMFKAVAMEVSSLQVSSSVML